MQQDEMAVFIFAMTALIAVSVIILSWIKHRSPKAGGAGSRETELLVNENAGLKSQVGRLEERIAVLERITVEKENSLAREIEQLRHG
jgi:membrane protein involved in colicin uptake